MCGIHYIIRLAVTMSDMLSLGLKNVSFYPPLLLPPPCRGAFTVLDSRVSASRNNTLEARESIPSFTNFASKSQSATDGKTPTTQTPHWLLPITIITPQGQDR